MLELKHFLFLFKSLYGLLMLLSQTKAFEILKNQINLNNEIDIKPSYIFDSLNGFSVTRI